MKHLEKLARKHLGEILVDEGLISKAQLVEAEREQQRSGEPLGPILVEANYITDWDLAKTVAAQYQLPYVDLPHVSVEKASEGILHPDEMQRYRLVPLDRLGNVLSLAVADMPSLEFLRSIKERSGLTPFLFVALLTDIQKVLVESSLVPPPAGPRVQTPEPPENPAEEPEELSEQDWQQGLAIFDQAMEGETPESEAAPEEEAAPESDDSWKNLFDSANESVLKEIDRG